MSVNDFRAEVRYWLTTAKHPRYKRLYIELTYQPMLEERACAAWQMK
jgi:hypothetical protein